MTWATATRPGGDYLVGHVVKLVAYREMLRYGTKNQNCGDWKGVVQVESETVQTKQLSSRAAFDRIRRFCFGLGVA
jgi:hypothetical protein